MTRGRGAGPGALYVARDNSIHTRKTSSGVVFLVSSERANRQRAHVCLLLFVVASPVARRSRACSQLALPPCRTSLLGSFQCIGGPGLAQGIGRDHRRPHLGMQRQYWSHATGIDDDGEVFVQARNISDDDSLATMRGRRVCYRDVPTATRMVCGKLPAVAKNAAIACGLSHHMQTQRQCHQAGFPSSVHATHHALQSVT